MRRQRPTTLIDWRSLAAWLSAASMGMGIGCAAFSSPDPNDMSDVRRSSFEDAESVEKELKQKSKREQFLGALHPDEIAKSMKSAIGQGPNRDYAREQYQKANEAYEAATKLQGAARSEKFVEAAKMYITAAARWPDSSLEQDALFMSAKK